MYSSTLFFELSLSASSLSAFAIIVSEVVAAWMEMEGVIENQLAIVRYDDLKKNSPVAYQRRAGLAPLS